MLYAYSFEGDNNEFVITRINDTYSNGQFQGEVSYKPGNLENCKFVMESVKFIPGSKYLFLICYEGNSMDKSVPVIFGHLMRVTLEVVVWES